MVIQVRIIDDWVGIYIEKDIRDARASTEVMETSSISMLGNGS